MNGDTQVNKENIPASLNTAAQTRANAHLQAPSGLPGRTVPEVKAPTQPITMAQGARDGCDPLSKAMDSLNGDARRSGQAQLDANR